MKHFIRTRFKERRFIKTRSIKTQMMSLFIGLIIAMLFILMIMNIWFRCAGSCICTLSLDGSCRALLRW